MTRRTRLAAFWIALTLAVGIPVVTVILLGPQAARAAERTAGGPWVFQVALQAVAGEQQALLVRATGFATREACEAWRKDFDSTVAGAGGRLKTPDGKVWRVLATRCWIDAITT